MADSAGKVLAAYSDSKTMGPGAIGRNGVTLQRHDLTRHSRHKDKLADNESARNGKEWNKGHWQQIHNRRPRIMVIGCTAVLPLHKEPIVAITLASKIFKTVLKDTLTLLHFVCFTLASYQDCSRTSGNYRVIINNSD